MTKMLYLSHIDWNWIKQRPQFLAEGLADKFELEVIHEVSFQRKNLQNREESNLKTTPLWRIPKSQHNPILKKINSSFRKRFVNKRILAINPEFLFLTFPNQISLIPDDYKGKIIYDCMDEHIAFLDDLKAKEELKKLEKDLVTRADYVFASSAKLKDNLEEKYGNSVFGKITIVRNGYNGDIIEPKESKKNDSVNFTIAYIGTISSWFNFSILEESMKQVDGLNYLLIGPLDNVTIPDNPRIKYVGTVEHNKLYATIRQADALIMPFNLNEVVEAVDPVKLYEYINYDKNIITVRYPEIERFSPFVYFYESLNDLVEIVSSLKTDDTVKYSSLEREEFLRENSWNQRVSQIINVLEA